MSYACAISSTEPATPRVANAFPFGSRSRNEAILGFVPSEYGLRCFVPSGLITIVLSISLKWTCEATASMWPRTVL